MLYEVCVGRRDGTMRPYILHVEKNTSCGGGPVALDIIVHGEIVLEGAGALQQLGCCPCHSHQRLLSEAMQEGLIAVHVIIGLRQGDLDKE